jgi:putative peptidoglycan lipid II flippase
LSLKKAASAVAVIGIANVFGYAAAMVRQAMIAAYFGAQSVTDAYVVAQTIPTMLEYVLAGAAIRAALLPIFTSELEEKGSEQAWKTASSIGNLVLLLMVFVMIIAMALSPILVRIVAPGLDAETTALARSLLIVMLPVMVFAAGIGIGAGILNALRHFTGPALRLFVMNSIGIACIYAFAQRIGIMSLAVGTVLGTLAAFALLLPILRKHGARYYFKLNWRDPVVGRFLNLAWPLIPTALVTITIDTIDRITASYLGEGSLAIFNFAIRIGDLPTVLLSTAIATVIFPALASRASKGKIDELRDGLSTGLRMTMFVTIPTTVVFIALSRQIVGFLLERGEFTAEAAAATGLSLAFYSIALSIRGMRGILINAFYSLKDTRTAVKLLAPTILYKIVLNYVLSTRMGVSGITLSTSIVNVIFFTLLLNSLRKKIGGVEGKRQMMSAAKILVAGVAMAVSIETLPMLIELPAGTSIDSLINLLVRAGAGLGIYALVSHLLKVEEFDLVRELIRDRISRPGRPRIPGGH